jgi:peptidoglycan/xylan/chitin deacetylase (PgdA/CDA1 family)
VAEGAFVPAPGSEELTIDKSAEVAVLCYHDFTEGEPSNDMVINIGEFRRQMVALRDAGIGVIGMGEFLAWRRGESDIPDPSVVITIDDGWESVYRLAFPVLREFGFPFTVFLYAQYVGGGGRALKVPQIQEMVAAGATVGCHSFTHPTPAKVRAEAERGGDRYEAFLLREMEASRLSLEESIGVDVATYAYPGGVFTERMVELNAARLGYDALFTIDGQKARWDTEAAKVGRYVVLGRDDGNYRLATTFSGAAGSALDPARGGPDADDGGLRPVFEPPDGAVVTDRRPRISVRFPDPGGIDLASVRMVVSGFGEVPATVDPEAGTVSWVPRAKIREAETEVSVTCAKPGEAGGRTLHWNFETDLAAAYLPGRPQDSSEGLVAPAGAGSGDGPDAGGR